MGVKEVFTGSLVARYGRAMRAAPREMIFNHRLILTTLLYAMAGVPLAWDQGSSSVIPSLPGFRNHFGISSGSDAETIRNYVSLVYISCGVGAGASFFINDRIGRLWSLRIYMTIWIIGQLVATFAPGLAGLYATRIISGLGIGPLTVIGPVSIAEIAPTEIRGLLMAWFGVVLLMALFVSTFCVYGVFLHSPAGRFQYQVVCFSPCIFMALCIAASFFLCESPRWLALVSRSDDAAKALVELRGLPVSHPRVQRELNEIDESIKKEMVDFGGEHSSRIMAILKETFTVPANLRRVQQALLSYSLAQLSGANSITAYFVPILTLMGVSTNTTQSLFLSGMYSMAKFFFTIMASFFFIDALGRRKSLFLGITLQMISDIYIGVYIKHKQQGAVSQTASEAAVAFIFIHGFGYAIGLLILPYVFTGEIWPNRIRSFGGALAQCWHWLFYYGVNYGMPSLLANTNNWGAFIFFAGWCFISFVYVYLMVPEIAGLSVEEIDDVFRGPWFNAYKRSQKVEIVDVTESEVSSRVS